MTNFLVFFILPEKTVHFIVDEDGEPERFGSHEEAEREAELHPNGVKGVEYKIVKEGEE